MDGALSTPDSAQAEADVWGSQLSGGEAAGIAMWAPWGLGKAWVLGAGSQAGIQVPNSRATLDRSASLKPFFALVAVLL